MVNPDPFGIQYDKGVKIGTVELYHWSEADGCPCRVMFFHDAEDHARWCAGASFRLLNHWKRSAPLPQYDKAERQQNKNRWR